MGCCLSSSKELRGLAVSATSDVVAPLEVAWATIQDVSSQPQFRKETNSIDFLFKQRDGTLKNISEERFVFEEGALWRENTTFEGDIYESLNSITSIKEVNSEDGKIALSRSVQIATQFTNRRKHKTTTHTATYSVLNNLLDKGDDQQKTCRLQVSMAYLPDGFWSQVDMRRRGKKLEVFAQCIFQKRLDEFAAEAERRYKETIKR